MQDNSQPSLGEIVDRLASRFEFEWRRGQNPVIEDYLDEVPSSQRLPLLRELLRIEIELRRTQGEEPSLDEYRDRFQFAATIIDELFSETPSSGCSQASKDSIPVDETSDASEVPAASSTHSDLVWLGRYRLERILGEGAFGTVYLARDTLLQRHVAIKTPRAERLKSPSDASKFLDEARLVARLDHPHVVPVYDVGRLEGGTCYVVSKYISGSDLAERMKTHRMQYREAARTIAAIADAVHYAHKSGLVHRDIKPANILIDVDDQPYVTDFGLALKVEDTGFGPKFAGTCQYMSPEQARSEAHLVDGRTDVFSLGVVLYELLTGKRPFDGNNAHRVLHNIKTVEARPPRQIDDNIPRDLERICLRALEKNISDRFTTAKDLADALRDFCDGKKETPFGDELEEWDFAEFIKEKRRSFCGRDWLFSEVESWLQSDSNDHALLITGDPGAGKSAIVAELQKRLGPHCVLATYFCQIDTPATLEPWRFVQNIAVQAGRNLASYGDWLADEAVRSSLSKANCQEDPLSAFEKGILLPLQKIAQTLQDTRCILVDGLDEALLSDKAIDIVDLLASKTRKLPSRIRLIATTRRDPDVIDKLAGLRVCQLNAQDNRNLIDIRRYLEARLAEDDFTGRLEENGVSIESAVEMLCEKSEGNFLYAAQALDGMERELYSFRDLEQLPPGLTSLYRQFFERVFPDKTSFADPKKVLEILSAAQEPLDEELLAEVADLEIDEGLAEVLEQLTPYLRTTVAGDGTTHHSIFHKSLSDWLTSKKRRGKIHFANITRGHEKLATFFLNDGNGGWASSDYAMQYLPRHLCGAKTYDLVEALLTDFAFLKRRVEEGQIYELVEDLAQATNELPQDRPQKRILSLLGESIRQDLHFITRHPTHLFQCLWNRSWWYDADEAAEHYLPIDDAEELPWGCNHAKLSDVLVRWLAQDELGHGTWLRSLRPPKLHLGTSQRGIMRGHDESVAAVAIASGADLIASGAYDCTVRVWDVRSCLELTNFVGQEQPVRAVEFLPDGKHLLVAHAPRLSPEGDVKDTDVPVGMLRILDSNAGREIAAVSAHEWGVTSVAISPDGRWLVSGGCDQCLRLWDERLRPLKTFTGHDSMIECVAVSPDGCRIASGSHDGTVRQWQANTGEQISCFDGHSSQVVESVIYSPDSKLLASGGWDKTVIVWNASTGEQIACLKGHERRILAVDFSADGARLASCSIDRTIRIWDTSAWEQVACLRGHDRGVSDLRFLPTGERLVSASLDKTLRIWDVRGGSGLIPRRGDGKWILNLDSSTDGRWLASVGGEPVVRVWDLASGELAAELGDHPDWVQCVAFSPDSSLIATGCDDHEVRLWDRQSGSLVATLRGHTDVVRDVAFASDGRTLVSSGFDKSVRLWDAQKKIHQRIYTGHSDWVQCVAVSPDGKSIAGGGGAFDSSVRIWHSISCEVVNRLEGLHSGIVRVAFSKDGSEVIAQNYYGDVAIWNVGTGKRRELGKLVWGSRSCDDDASGILISGSHLETQLFKVKDGSAIGWYPVRFNRVLCPTEGLLVGVDHDDLHILRIGSLTQATSRIIANGQALVAVNRIALFP